VRDDVPAAFPLLGLIAGLAIRATAREACAFAAIGILLGVLRHRRAAAMMLFVALGIVVMLRDGQRIAAETRAFASLDTAQFVTVEAPLERDWAVRGDSYVLRSSRFRVNGHAFATPIAAYARFEPPAMSMEATLHAEGFLHRNAHGDYSLTIKSPVLLSYTGQLDPRTPAAWNRILANRLRPHAALHPTEVALVEALVLGRGERLTDEMRESFKRGGTYHLLVFSGLQIAVAAGALAALLRWCHKPRIADWLLLAFATLAPLFIGPTASVARASIAIGLYAVSRILKRPTSFENLWCVAALLRLAMAPGELTDASFHLTYAGAGALLFIGKPWRKQGAAPQLIAAELAVTPLTLFHFHQYALGGSIMTLVMSPLLMAMLVIAMLACAWPCAALFDGLGLLHGLCGWLNELGAYVSGVYTAPPVAAMVCSGLAALIALAVLREKMRAIALALILLVPSFAAVVHSRAQREVEHPRALFLDVGQGDAIALRDRNHVVLVDAGISDRRLLPLLLDRGITRIDLAVLTHAHPDHCGALATVIERMQVRELWISPRRFRGDCASDVLDAATRSGTPIHLVRDGDTRTLGTMRFVAHVPDRTFRRSPDNNASVVLHVTIGKRRILLTGDIEREAELWLADRDLHADVLKVAHHGSRTSSTRLFLDTVAPRVAVISCGRRNQFGHPHPAVLDALAQRHVRVWRTDRNGTISLELLDDQLRVLPEFDTPEAPP
jgi:competence protein ComEC